jgi:ABC-2 type transport system permease protein
MLMSKSCGLDDAAWWKYLCVIMLGLVISIILGAAVGVMAKDQMAATSLAVPVMCLFSFLPMMAQFNDTIAKVAKYFYTQQLYLALSDINNVKIGTEGLIIIAVNAVVILGFFVLAFRKEGLSNE